MGRVVGPSRGSWQMYAAPELPVLLVPEQSHLSVAFKETC